MYGRARTRRRKSAAARILLLTAATVCLITVFVLIFAGFRSTAEAAASESAACYKYYTGIEIQKGDTLWDLSSEYIDEHYDSVESYIAEVVRINSLDDADDIICGQHIIMPYYSSEYK